MKRTKEDYPSFNLFSIVGTWESINLNPTVIIYRNDKDYLLSIIYVSETTKQASPTTYEIQKEGSLYFIAPAPKQIYICLLYTSPSPRDRQKSRMPSSA